MFRRLLPAMLVCLLSTSCLEAADDLPANMSAVPGTCFVYEAAPETAGEIDPASAIVERLDLQPLQFKTEGKPIPVTRLRIGVLLKGQTGPIPNDISAACTGEGLTFTCTMRCGEKIVGKFSAEALPTKPTDPKADYLKLVIEAPTVLNGCTAGKEPFDVPAALIGKQIILKGAATASCFR
ncbi:MAG: hypothetical protein ABI391_06665 [Hyphomicrobiaceae bacterium]